MTMASMEASTVLLSAFMCFLPSVMDSLRRTAQDRSLRATDQLSGSCRPRENADHRSSAVPPPAARDRVVPSRAPCVEEHIKGDGPTVFTCLQARARRHHEQAKGLRLSQRPVPLAQDEKPGLRRGEAGGGGGLAKTVSPCTVEEM